MRKNFFQPAVELSLKALPGSSRSLKGRSPFQDLLTPKGEVCASTAGLPVPVRVVIDHSHLTPLSGQSAPCNKDGSVRHDPRTPIFHWYQNTPVGKELYLVIYTRGCRWSKCSFCTLPSQSSADGVSPKDIYQQAVLVFDSLTMQELEEIRRFSLSNNGSIFDRSTMPRDSLRKIIRLAHQRCPNLEIVCLETRLETVSYAEICELEQWLCQFDRACRSKKPALRLAPERARLQILSGYETQDPYLRNAVLWKGYPEDRVQKFFEDISSTQKATGRQILLDEYVMIKPAAGMTNEESVDEAVETVLHLWRLGDYYDIRVSVRLNPTFAAVGSELYYQVQQGHYEPHSYFDLLAVLRRLHSSPGWRQAPRPIFVGLHNEGLAYDEGTMSNADDTDKRFYTAIQSYNFHQDFSRLESDTKD